MVSIEQDRDHHRFIQQCLAKLENNVQPSTFNVQCIRADVFRYVKSCREQFDFIFADPPYALKELPTIPTLIFDKGLLKPGGVFVFEHGKDYNFSEHPRFAEHRSYGSVNFSIFTSAEPATEPDSQTDEP